MNEVQMSLLEESDRAERLERTKAYRQKAFRIAFDFLEKHLPVLNTDDYWKLVCADIGIASTENDDNELCQELLCAVLNYLGSYARK